MNRSPLFIGRDSFITGSQDGGLWYVGQIAEGNSFLHQPANIGQRFFSHTVDQHIGSTIDQDRGL